MDLGMALRGVAWRRLGALVEGVKFGFRGGGNWVFGFFFLPNRYSEGGAGCRPGGGRSPPTGGRERGAAGQGGRAPALLG